MRLPLAGRPTKAAVIVVLGWAAAAAVAGFISVAAIGAVSDGIFGSSTTPLSADQIDQQLAAQSTASATPGATTSPPGTSAPPSTPPATSPPTEPPATEPPAQSETKVINTAGGTIFTRCDASAPVIVSVTPAQGFQAEKKDEGEGLRVELESESRDLKVRVEITCSGGVPTWTIEND